MSRIPNIIFTWLVAGAVTACGERASPLAAPADDAARLASRLTAEAASQLGSDGLLNLVTVAQGTAPEISEPRARELALVAGRSFGPMMRPALEEDHGGPIDFGTLVVCPRAYYAASPVEPLPQEIPSYYHRLFGPRWLVSLCDGRGEQQVSIAVSALATELDIANGHLIYGGDSQHGAEFEILGVPRSLGELPISPERAVFLATDVAQPRRIAKVHQLVVPVPGTGFPQTAHWQLDLESSAALRVATADGAVTDRVVGQLLVGLKKFRKGNRVRIATAAQPSAVDFEWRESAREGMAMAEVLALPRHAATVRLRSNTVTAFDDVVMVTLPR